MALRCSSNASCQANIFYKDAFSYYLIAAEYRFVGEQVRGGPEWAIRNNGLMLHSPHPRTMLKEQDFPIALEIQLLGGLSNGRPRTTANVKSYIVKSNNAMCRR